MSKQDLILIELMNIKESGVTKITLDELHNIMRRLNIIQNNHRKDYIMWLIATGKIQLNGIFVEFK